MTVSTLRGRLRDGAAILALTVGLAACESDPFAERAPAPTAGVPAASPTTPVTDAPLTPATGGGGLDAFDREFERLNAETQAQKTELIESTSGASASRVIYDGASEPASADRALEGLHGSTGAATITGAPSRSLTPAECARLRARAADHTLNEVNPRLYLRPTVDAERCPWGLLNLDFSDFEPDPGPGEE